MSTATRLPVVDQVFGHNRAPIAEVLKTDFVDLVADVNAAIDAAAALPTAINNDEIHGRVGQGVIALRAVAKRIEAARKEEGEPLLTTKRELDAWFNNLLAQMTEAAQRLQLAADAYTRRKAAEARAAAQRKADEAARKAEEERRKGEAAKTAAGAARAEGRAEHFEDQAERAAAIASASDAELVRTRTGGVTASATAKWEFTIEDYDAIDLNKLRPYFARADVEKAIRSLVRIQKGSTAMPGVRVFEDTRASFRR